MKCPQYNHYFNKLLMMSHLIIKINGVTIASHREKNHERENQHYHAKLENIHKTEMLCRLLKQQPAPKVDIDCFDGNLLNYTYFRDIFKEVVESKIVDTCCRVTNYINYTKGEPKNL